MLDGLHVCGCIVATAFWHLSSCTSALSRNHVRKHFTERGIFTIANSRRVIHMYVLWLYMFHLSDLQSFGSAFRTAVGVDLKLRAVDDHTEVSRQSLLAVIFAASRIMEYNSASPLDNTIVLFIALCVFRTRTPELGTRPTVLLSVSTQPV